MSYKQKDKTTEQNLKFWNNKLNEIGTYSNPEEPEKEIQFSKATGFFSLNLNFSRSEAVNYCERMINNIKNFDKK